MRSHNALCQCSACKKIARGVRGWRTNTTNIFVDFSRKITKCQVCLIPGKFLKSQNLMRCLELQQEENEIQRITPRPKVEEVTLFRYEAFDLWTMRLWHVVDTQKGVKNTKASPSRQIRSNYNSILLLLRTPYFSFPFSLTKNQLLLLEVMAYSFRT